MSPTCAVAVQVFVDQSMSGLRMSVEHDAVSVTASSEIAPVPEAVTVFGTGSGLLAVTV